MSRDAHGEPEWSAELMMWPPEHREWAELAASSMCFFDADVDAIAPALAEVRESVVASGQTPTELFGEPVLYGRTRGKALRPSSDVLEAKLPFRDGAGALVGCLAGMGFLVFVLGLWLGFTEGWMTVSFTGPVMLLFPLLAALVGIGIWGWVLRTRGRLRAPIAIWAGALAGIAGTIALVSYFDDLDIPGPPNWVMPLIGAGLMALAFSVPQSKVRSLIDDAGWDDEHWFAHAENLLRGRYLFSRVQAVETLREAREHRLLSGARGTAAEEFGNVELFVAQLAPGRQSSIKRGVVLRRAGFSLIVACFGVSLAAEFFEEPITVWLVVRAVMWSCLAVGIIVSWRPKSIHADVEEARKRRVADARILSADQSED